MKRVIVTLVLFVMSLALWNCGGGGATGSNDGGGADNKPIIIDVAPGKSATATSDNTTFNIPSSALPQGGQVTITKEKNPTLLPVGDGKLIGVQYKITSSTPLASPISVEIRNTPLKGTSVLVGRRNEMWEELSSSTSGQTLKGEVLISEEGRSANSPWLGIVMGLCFPDYVVTHGVALKQVAGSGKIGQGRSAILTHGWCSSDSIFNDFTNDLVASELYNNIFVLVYDWRLSGEKVARGLADILQPFRESGKVVDLIGHSKGGLNNTYALEVLEETHAVNNNITIDSPHQGPRVDNAMGLLKLTRFLHLNEDSIGIALPLVGDPALEDMAQGSAFMKAFDKKDSQRGYTNYLLITGDNDFIVAENSGTALHLPMNARTAGKVQRVVLPTQFLGNNHSELLRSPEGRKAVIAEIEKFAINTTSIGLSVSPSPVQGGSDGWSESIKISSGLNRSVVLKQLIFDTYDMAGDWYTSQWFNDPTSDNVFFPNKQVEWNYKLAPSELRTIDIHCSYDYQRNSFDQTQASNRGKHTIFTLIVDDGGTISSVQFIQEQYNSGYWPESAKTRSQGRREGGPQVFSAR